MLAGEGLNAELNPICHLLALLEAHHILHVSRIRIKRRVKSHLASAGIIRSSPILHVSRIRVKRRVKSHLLAWNNSAPTERIFMKFDI